MIEADHGLHGEIHSLAAEIVHAYEELHLLYELGQVLTSDLTVSEVTGLIVEKIFQALIAGDAELSLTSASLPVRISRDSVGAAGPDHRLSTALRSSGEIVGRISLARSPSGEPFSSADGKLLDAVGTLAANAIRNAQLLQELRATRRTCARCSTTWPKASSRSTKRTASHHLTRPPSDSLATPRST